MYELDDPGTPSFPTAGQVLLGCLGFGFKFAWQGGLVYLIWAYVWMNVVPEFGQALPLGTVIALTALLSLTFNGALKLLQRLASRVLQLRKPSGRPRVPGGTSWAQRPIRVKLVEALVLAMLLVAYVGFDFLLWSRVAPILLPGLFVPLTFGVLLAVALVRHGLWLADRGLNTLMGLLFPRDEVSADQA